MSPAEPRSRVSHRTPVTCDPPPRARSATHRHIPGIRSNQVRTPHRSVLCSWACTHTGRSDRTCCRPRRRRHTRSLQGRERVCCMFAASLKDHMTALTLAGREGVIPRLAAVAALPVDPPAAQAAAGRVTHLPRRPSVVTHTLCAQT